MKKYFSPGIVVLMILFANVIWAQQDPQYTQYMYNTQVVNPGYVGSKLHTSMSSSLHGPVVIRVSIREPFSPEITREQLRYGSLGLMTISPFMLISRRFKLMTCVPRPLLRNF